MLNQWIHKLTLAASFMVAIATVTIVKPKIAFSLTPTEVRERAESVTVRINGPELGSGVIIAQSGDQYTVLTNWHVLDSNGDYEIQTSKGTTYLGTNRRPIKGVDLALIDFNSNQPYEVAIQGNSDNLTEGQDIYFSGYPAPQAIAKQRNLVFDRSELNSFLSPSDIKNGYEFSFTGVVLAGLSGSPIFDTDGTVIGIYGRGYRNPKTGHISLYGIPINKAKLENWDMVCGSPYRQPELGKLINLAEKEQLISKITKLVNEGHRQHRQGQYREARKQYNEAIKLTQKHNQNCYNALYYQGDTLSKLRLFTKAIAAFDNAIQISPDKYNTFNTFCKKAKVLFLLGKRKEAQENYQTAIFHRPDALTISQDCKILSEHLTNK